MSTSVNVLPDMDEPRLKSLGKQLNRNRKTSLISTGKVKDNLDVYVKSLNKEKRSLNGKYHLRGMRLKRSLANVRGTQKVLKGKREQSFWEDSDEYPYGVYEGESLNSYRRQVDNIIEQKHPKYRRQKKVEQHLKNGLLSGRILDNSEAKTQFNEIMAHGRRTKRSLRRENPLTKTFINYSYNKTSSLDHLWKDPNIKKQYSLKHRPVDEIDVSETYSPIEIKVKSTKGTTGFARIYSPKATPDENATPTNFKSHRRITALRKSPLSMDSPYTEASTDIEDDYMTVRSSPSKLNLPPIAASKNFMKSGQSKDTGRKFVLPDLTIRRATKGDVVNNLSLENLQEFDRMKNRRATTML